MAVRNATMADVLKGGVFHYSACEPGRIERWRTNGKVKQWVTRPDEFRAPVKHGLYSYGYITHETVGEFHREEDCQAR